MDVVRENGEVQHFLMLRPSNFHAHIRLGHLMEAIAYDVMSVVKYLLIMPNDGLVDTIEKVTARYEELRALAAARGVNPTFIMTVYLTSNVTSHMIERLARLPFKVEVKYYPPEAGATTGSGFGIPLEEAEETLRAMAECEIPLLGHFESVKDSSGRTLPHDQRETYFMEHVYPRLRYGHPWLLISIEHVSTLDAIKRVKEDSSGRTVCTLTPHHLLLSIEELKRLSWANHGKCMPIPKGLDDVDACREFATSGDTRAIAGNDTAAHLSRAKEGPFDQAANGAFWTAHSIAAYALAFERAGALDARFERFMSINGATWRDLELPAKDDRIMVVREREKDIPSPVAVPEENDIVIPLGWTTKDDRLKLGLVVAE